MFKMVVLVEVMLVFLVVVVCAAAVGKFLLFALPFFFPLFFSF